MSVNGVGPAGQVPVPSLRPTESAPKEQAPAEAPLRGAVPQPPASLGVAALAPPGTDPNLWSVLTAEERSYFEQVQALGPVTYGPSAAAADPAVPRGTRVDVRV